MSRSNKSLIYFGYFIIVIQALIPLYFMFKYSISDRSSIVTGGDLIPLWPYEPTLMVYKYVFSDSYLWGVIFNSISIALLTLSFSLVLGVSAAYILADLGGKLKYVLLITVMSIRVFPDIITVIPIAEVFVKFNLDNSIIGISLAHTLLALPYVIYMMLAGFENLPKDIEDQALILGANRFQAITKVVLPVVFPSIVISAIYVFILSWDEFVFSYFLLGFGDTQSLPVYLKKLLGFQPPQNILMAVSMILTVPVIFFTVLIQKYIVNDTKAGAVKE